MRIVVAGAARGIGLALCHAFAEAGDEVIAVGRSASPELCALGVEILDGVDFTDDDAVAALPERIEGRRLDVLFYNAGINIDRQLLEDLVVADAAHAFDVNTLGAVRTVLALLPLLGTGSKIALMSTSGKRALNMGEWRGSGAYGYRMSKAALISFGFGLARELRPRGIAVLIAAPGPVETDMTHGAVASRVTHFLPGQLRQPLEVARLLRDRVFELDLAASPAWQETPLGDPVAL